MIDKVYGNMRITMDVENPYIEERFISITDVKTNFVCLRKTGKFELTSIDNGVMAISKDDQYPSTIFVMYKNEKITIRTIKKEPGKTLEVDEELKKRKLIIVPKGTRYVVFDYDNNAILSPEFDEIKPKGDLFSVKYNLFVVDRVITLTGYLNSNGDLIDSELYSSVLNTTITVNSLDINGSLARLYPTLEKLLLKEDKKQKQTQILDFEYEAYKRRRQKKGF